MATKTNKTVGKTTNTIKKGVKVMTQEDLINNACDAIAYKLNQRIINTNKKYHTALELVKKEQILQDFTNKNELRTLEVLGRYLEYRYIEQRREYYLNKAYGLELPHYSEVEQTTEPTKKERLIQAEETQKKATKKTNKAITKALQEGGDK